MSRSLGFAAAVVAVALVIVGPAASAAPRKPPKGGPVVVGTDADNDWGVNASAPPPPEIGNALGQELVEASIGKGEDGETINFVIKVKSLPPAGGAPEVTRYTWNFAVGKEPLELDGKFTNYTRGICDPTAGTCPPPRDPGMQPFFLRGDCMQQATPATTLTFCREFAKIQAIFDPSEGTITIPVPIDALEAKPGAKILPGTNIFGGSISAAPAAFLTYGAYPMDTMVVTKPFAIPR